MKKIVVTGATSMIGTALIEEALANGVEVYAIIRPDTRRRDRLPADERLHLVEADLPHLRDASGIPADCDTFYHFAWAYTTKDVRDDPILQIKNIGYTMDAVALAKACGCSKFIGAGSQAEYGPVNGVIDASARFSPQIAYGAAKYAAGLLSRKECDRQKMVHIWARVFSVYGGNDNKDTLLDYAIRRFLQGEKASFSSAQQKWDYLYEKDAGKIFYLLGERVAQSKTYRIANGHARKLKEYITVLARQMNAEQLCAFGEPDPPRTPPGIEADISDLAADIGYAPETDFQTGIAAVIRQYKAVQKPFGEEKP